MPTWTLGPLGWEGWEFHCFCGWLSLPLALPSGGSPKEDVDPFYYGKPGGAPLPPFLSLPPPTAPPLAPLSWLSFPGSLGLLLGWAVGRGAWDEPPTSLPPPSQTTRLSATGASSLLPWPSSWGSLSSSVSGAGLILERAATGGPQVGVGGSPLTPLPRCQKGSESLGFPHSPMQGDAGCGN